MRFGVSFAFEGNKRSSLNQYIANAVAEADPYQTDSREPSHKKDVSTQTEGELFIENVENEAIILDSSALQECVVGRITGIGPPRPH